MMVLPQKTHYKAQFKGIHRGKKTNKLPSSYSPILASRL